MRAHLRTFQLIFMTTAFVCASAYPGHSRIDFEDNDGRGAAEEQNNDANQNNQNNPNNPNPEQPLSAGEQLAKEFPDLFGPNVDKNSQAYKDALKKFEEKIKKEMEEAGDDPEKKQALKEKLAELEKLAAGNEALKGKIASFTEKLSGKPSSQTASQTTANQSNNQNPALLSASDTKPLYGTGSDMPPVETADSLVQPAATQITRTPTEGAIPYQKPAEAPSAPLSIPPSTVQRATAGPSSQQSGYSGTRSATSTALGEGNDPADFRALRDAGIGGSTGESSIRSVSIAGNSDGGPTSSYSPSFDTPSLAETQPVFLPRSPSPMMEPAGLKAELPDSGSNSSSIASGGSVNSPQQALTNSATEPAAPAGANAAGSGEGGSGGAESGGGSGSPAAGAAAGGGSGSKPSDSELPSLSDLGQNAYAAGTELLAKASGLMKSTGEGITSLLTSTGILRPAVESNPIPSGASQTIGAATTAALGNSSAAASNVKDGNSITGQSVSIGRGTSQPSYNSMAGIATAPTGADTAPPPPPVPDSGGITIQGPAPAAKDSGKKISSTDSKALTFEGEETPASPASEKTDRKLATTKRGFAAAQNPIELGEGEADSFTVYNVVPDEVPEVKIPSQDGGPPTTILSAAASSKPEKILRAFNEQKDKKMELEASRLSMIVRKGNEFHLKGNEILGGKAPAPQSKAAAAKKAISSRGLSAIDQMRGFLGFRKPADKKKPEAPPTKQAAKQAAIGAPVR